MNLDNIDNDTTDDLELQLLLEAIYQRYGHDFRQYAQASVKRRVRHYLGQTEFEHIADLIPAILHQPKYFHELLFAMSVTVTELFRDPWFFQALQSEVFPFLQTFPFFNIWHAGCATGEEVYSLAILLQEAGLYDRAHIYATDFNDTALEKAASRIYPLRQMREYSEQYRLAGGKFSLADYYHSRYDSVILDQSLQRNITFANHNLVTDGPFAEMHLILCRNVLIYFNKKLQDKVLTTLSNSLCHNGFLCLGSKESLQFSEVGGHFNELEQGVRIYQYKAVI
ncbi:MAG TPA: protein-glutamate O-methyltransferase CheR [Anaerolineae bacterium]|nr:protein-glutamate O-methyltransferase CheR [Anaerolineae bacterium]